MTAIIIIHLIIQKVSAHPPFPDISEVQRAQQRRQAGLILALEEFTVCWEVDTRSTIKKCCARAQHFPKILRER